MYDISKVREEQRKQIESNISKGIVGDFITESELEKGGEGSRGGHVIGHTKSGKPIYEKVSPTHSTYSNFSKKDHEDASNAHHLYKQTKERGHKSMSEGHAELSKKESSEKKTYTIAEINSFALKAHQQNYEIAIQAGKSHKEAGEIAAKQAEMVRDGMVAKHLNKEEKKSIGQTQSGKSIYESHTPIHEDYKDFTKEDHIDASRLHRDLATKTQSKLSQHSVKHNDKNPSEKVVEERKKLKSTYFNHNDKADYHYGYAHNPQFEKSIEDNNLEKAFSDVLEKAKVPHNPNLRLVHIVDKNGHHRVVWKLPEDVKKEEKEDHKLVDDVKPGDEVTYEGNVYTVKKVKSDGYVKIENEHGQLDRSSSKLKFHHPITGEVTATINTGTAAKVVSAEDDLKPARDYEIFGTPAERMSDWVGLVDSFSKGTSKNLTIAYGTGGVGKTFNVLQNEKIKKEIAEGKTVKFTGGTTGAGFFEMLYNNRDKNIILDDFDMVFNDPGMLGILATISRSSEDRTISNPVSQGGISLEDSEGEKIPSSFKFEGKIMIISNINIDEEAESGPNKAKFEELLTNSSKVDLKMSKKETWDLINNFILRDGRDKVRDADNQLITNPNKGGINMGLKFQDAYGSEKDVSMEDREELGEYFSNNWQQMKELSGRTLTKANAIQQFYKRKGEKWQDKADKLLLIGGDANLPIEERFKSFNDSIEMVANGELKSSIISAKNSNDIVDFLRSKGFKKTKLIDDDEDVKKSIRGKYDMVKQMKHDYIPRPGDKFVTEQFAVFTGKAFSDRALYEKLWEQNGKVIVFDHTASSFLNSDLGQGLLKGALDTSGDGEIAWLSKTKTGRVKVLKKGTGEPEEQYQARLRSEGYNFEVDDEGKIDMKTMKHPYDIPDKFKFKGRCIFVTDGVDEAPQPIQSRSMIANIDTTPEEFITMAQSVADNRERLGHQFSHVFEGVEPKEYRGAIKTLQSMLGSINPRYYSEEGIQNIIRITRDHPELEHDELKRKIKREMAKGFIEDDLFYGNENILKAFKSLL